jgi:hypothetical protein
MIVEVLLVCHTQLQNVCKEIRFIATTKMKKLLLKLHRISFMSKTES